jgi:hypothetical protein
VHGLRYCIVELDSLSGDIHSALEPLLSELTESEASSGVVDLHIIDAPYGLGKVEWDKEPWTQEQFSMVLEVRSNTQSIIPKPFRKFDSTLHKKTETVSTCL